jgi:DNA-binding SARP family transcriptional activator
LDPSSKLEAGREPVTQRARSDGGNGSAGGTHDVRETTIAGRVVDQLGIGILLTDDSGAVIEANQTARGIISAAYGSWPDEASCCSLFGCYSREPLANHCISRLAARSVEPIPELRVDLPPERPTAAAWVTAVKNGDGRRLLMHLRPASLGDRRQRTKPHWMAEPRIGIRALGRTQVQTEETRIEGDWLLQRPGQLLKYLVCQRGRPAHVDEIVETLWPGSGTAGRGSVRYFVHALRRRLEPERALRAPSAFICSANSTYYLGASVHVDLDEFEVLIRTGVQRLEGDGEQEEGVRMLQSAMELYRGDLFQEEPFAEWAFSERDAARSLAFKALMELSRHHRQHGEAAEALTYLERSAALWPLDPEVQRSLLGLYLEQGRHSDARRRYETFRRRFREDFGQDPGFRLADLENGRPG